MYQQQPAPPVNFFRAAFFQQHNLILLAGAAGLALAFWSVTPLLVAVVGESLWLLIAPTSAAFQRRIAERTAAQPPAAADRGASLAGAPAAPLPSLPPGPMIEQEQAHRLRELEAIAGDIHQLAAERGADPALLAHLGARLQALHQSFLRMAAVRHRLARFLGDGRSAQLEQEVVRLGQALAAEKDLGVKLSLRQALSIGQRQLKQHEQIENTRRALDVKMATLEMSFGYLRSLLVGGGTEADLIAHLEELESGTGFVGDLESETSAVVAGGVAGP